MYYEPILKTLFQHEVRYLVIGGLAVNLHGVPRMTVDLDIVLSTDTQNLQKLLTVMHDLEFYPRLPIPAEDLLNPTKRSNLITQRNMIAFSFIHDDQNMGEIDILLINSINFNEAFNRRIVLTLDDYKINLISLEHLQQMKRDTGRAQDTADIEMLERVKRDSNVS